MAKKDNRAKAKVKYLIDLDLNGNLIQQCASKNLTKLGKRVDYPRAAQDVIDSWQDCFRFLEGDGANIPGLRKPQIGAIHAILAHWSVSDEPATVVMPTGTGKTETMLGVAAIAQCSKTLIIVPTDALRSQIAAKFLSLGILKNIGVISENALSPLVGTICRQIQTGKQIDEIFEKCNVIVTTMQIASQCTAKLQEKMALWCTHLFVDEAHHIAADSWGRIIKKFRQNKIIQFTATPFRNDDRAIGGKIIYDYPLSRALHDGYFKKISFAPVREYNLKKSDRAIAARAVERLRADIKKGYNHVLMARVKDKKRAGEVFELYKAYPEFNPIQLHTGLSDALQKANRELLLSGKSKIVVCVNMLGEGFDFPELKIAAFHDIKKSLPATLQLAGRFTRTRLDVGSPTFIANIANVEAREEIQKLYSRDSNWNTLLPQSSETIVQKKINFFNFLDGFKQLPDNFPIQSIKPAMSTVIYKTKAADWSPEKFLPGIEKIASVEPIYFDINMKENVLVIIGARKIPLDWAHIKEVSNLDWELTVLFWDKGSKLLFINSSTNNGYFRRLAESVAGKVELVKNLDVFRSFAGINRLKLQNVGLINQLGKQIKYTMSAGSDIEAALPRNQIRTSRRANIFGTGYENGKKVSLGCSYKGRVWARNTGNLEELTIWCKEVGKKVLDINIDPEKVLEGALKSDAVSTRPQKVPTYIDWPDQIYQYPEHLVEFIVDNKHRFELLEADIRLINMEKTGDLDFEIVSDQVRIQLKLSLTLKAGVKDCVFRVTNGKKVVIRRKASEMQLEDFFYNFRPTIYFHDGSSLEGNIYTELSKLDPPFDVKKIDSWDWGETNIKKESQGLNKEKDSIQYKVIQTLLKDAKYDVIFDDDSSGEAADIVAVKRSKNTILIDFYHCKFSKAKTTGARIDDLYEVCGQAQKSTRWMEKIYDKPKEIFSHLLRREVKRLDNNGGISRLEKGSTEDLETLEVQSLDSPITLRIFIVQPGLSKHKVTPNQLDLLGATESYLKQTYGLEFGVIGSR